MVTFRALFPDELANLQHLQPADDPRTEHQGKQQSRDARQREAHRDVTKYVERVKIGLQHVVEEVEKHLSRAPWKCRLPGTPRAPRPAAQIGRRALRRCAPSLLRANPSRAASPPAQASPPRIRPPQPTNR